MSGSREPGGRPPNYCNILHGPLDVSLAVSFTALTICCMHSYSTVQFVSLSTAHSTAQCSIAANPTISNITLLFLFLIIFMFNLTVSN